MITVETSLGGGSSEGRPMLREEITAVRVREYSLYLGRGMRWAKGVYMGDLKGRINKTRRS